MTLVGSVFDSVLFIKIAKPPMQASIIHCLSQARINWEICGRKGIQSKKWGDDGGGAPIIQVGWRPDGLSVHLPLLSFPPP